MTKVTIVETSTDGSIPVRELKPGQVGEITQWGGCSGYCGTVVKLSYLGSLEALGGESCWDKESMEHLDACHRVRIVPNGTLLKVEKNE